jgi:hypothetical protein
MVFALLSCISLLVLISCWFLYGRNLELFLCLLIAINFEFFSMLPKFVGYKYLLLPMIAVLMFEGFVTRKLALGRYGWWVISFLAISCMGVVVAWSLGQGMVLSLKTAKFVPLVLIYFLLAGRRIDVDKFAGYFIGMSLVVASLATVCYLTHGAVNFFPEIPAYALVGDSGRLRITAGQFVISAAAVVAFARFTGSSRWRYLLAAGALFAEVVFAQQTRGFVAAIFLSMCVIYVLSYRLTMLRFACYLVFGVCCLSAWLYLSGVDLSGLDFVKRTQGDFKSRSGKYGGSLQGRLNAYLYYSKEIQKYPLTGRGLQNFNWEKNPEKSLQKYSGISLSDIGIVHFLVEAGLVGGVWLLYGLLKLWRDVFRLRRHLVVASYFIIGTITMPTLDMFLRQDDTQFLFAVFLGLVSSMTLRAGAGVGVREAGGLLPARAPVCEPLPAHRGLLAG